MRLGEYFTLDEMTRTGTRALNHPNKTEIVNLTRLVALVLDPLRAVSGALTITSGYRSEVVNKNVGGVPTSYHRQGLAVDMVSDSYTPYELADLIREMKLPVDKVIVEFDEWVHCQIKRAGSINRYEYLVASKDGGDTTYTFMS